MMGGNDPDGFPTDGEGPVRQVTLSPFRIDPFATTNLQFAEFVDATGYRTDAEGYGWSFPDCEHARQQHGQHGVPMRR